jgi:hypothetical protein
VRSAQVYAAIEKGIASHERRNFSRFPVHVFMFPFYERTPVDQNRLLLKRLVGSFQIAFPMPVRYWMNQFIRKKPAGRVYGDVLGDLNLGAPNFGMEPKGESMSRLVPLAK